MKVSRFVFQTRRKMTMKRALLVVTAALLFLNALVVPTVVQADTGNGGANCSGSTGNCKP
jgi:hypothetical protein